MDIRMGRVRATASVSIDPLEPVLSTVSSRQVLKVIRRRDALRFRGSQEVPGNGVGIISKRHFNGALEAVNVTVIAGTLVGLVFLHQGDEFFGLPPFGLEIVVIGGRGSGVHHLKRGISDWRTQKWNDSRN